MTYEDKIVKGGEITSQGVFDKGTNGTFYLMIVPKAEDAGNVAILNVKISQNTERIDFPFVAGMWNPIVVNSVDVKANDLSNYRIFYGETL